MVLNDNNGTAIRVGDVRNMNKIIVTSGSAMRYSIELRFKKSAGYETYRYGGAEDARDKDFERINSAMDALDGVQVNQQ